MTTKPPLSAYYTLPSLVALAAFSILCFTNYSLSSSLLGISVAGTIIAGTNSIVLPSMIKRLKETKSSQYLYLLFFSPIITAIIAFFASFAYLCAGQNQKDFFFVIPLVSLLISGSFLLTMCLQLKK